MKKSLLVMCAAAIFLCTACAKEDVNTAPESERPESTATAPAVDNGVDAFLRGENPELIEKYSD